MNENISSEAKSLCEAAQYNVLYTIKVEDLQLDRLSKMALEDPSTGGNPKKLTEADMKIMYQHSMSGTLF